MTADLSLNPNASLAWLARSALRRASSFVRPHEITVPQIHNARRNPMMTVTRFSFLLTLTLLFALVSSAASAGGPIGAQSVDEAWRRAIIANDLDAVVSNYSKDAVMWLPDAAEAKGREAIRDSYAGLLAANTVTGAAFANTHYRTSGNLSVGWGDFTLTLSPKAGGSPVSLSGRFSVIAKKEGRKWVYLVDHASAKPASAAPR